MVKPGKSIVPTLFLGLLVPMTAYAADNQGQDPFKSPFSFGYQGSGSGSGISLRFGINDRTRIQAITWVSSDYYNEGSIGVRVMKDLGFKGGVSRYYGVGAGIGYDTVYDYSSATPGMDTRVIVPMQGFLGLELPWTWFDARSPVSALNTSLEVGVGAGIVDGRFKPKTTVNFGIHYNF